MTDLEFDEKYEGEGVWIVTMKPPPYNELISRYAEVYEYREFINYHIEFNGKYKPYYSWRVYESTGTATPIGTVLDNEGRGITRHSC